MNSLLSFENYLITNPWIKIHYSIKVNHLQTSIIEVIIIVNDAKSFIFLPRYGNSPGCSNTVLNRNEILYQLHELMKRNERKSRNRRLDDECSIWNDKKLFVAEFFVKIFYLIFYQFICTICCLLLLFSVLKLIFRSWENPFEWFLLESLSWRLIVWFLGLAWLNKTEFPLYVCGWLMYAVLEQNF